MKYKVQDRIAHRHQELHYSCGAASVAMLLGQPESVIRPLVGCDSSGTPNERVYQFLCDSVATSHRISLHKNYEDCIDNLTQLSLRFPLYCAATYLWKNPGRGRPVTRHHASIFVDGTIYDPAEKFPADPEAYVSTFNKRLTYNTIIIVEVERPNFLSNFRKHELVA